MQLLILILLVILIVLVVLTLLKLSSRVSVSGNEPLKENIERSFLQIENLLKDEFLRNREESSNNERNTRLELGNLFKNFEDSINKKINYIQEQLSLGSKDSREEISKSLKSFEQEFSQSVKEFNDLQKQKFDELIQNQTEINKTTEQRLDKMRETIDIQLKTIQQENSKKLDEMRTIVDEKLQATLEKRLTESFKQVSERLEQVHKGLGEMQTLATGVGDLKKVLSNVKTRGILGEIQLGNILEQILAPEQYERNVKTKIGSNEMVEFAIKLPGRDDTGQVVYLPLDSKFPIERYYSLVNAYDGGKVEVIEQISKQLENDIKKCAKDIRDKYIEPPSTTDFGIMFLPVEGLYAEVVRRANLIETLQREFRIVVTGPSTLAALLNSLQMGFKTLAIEKRASEVWKILGAIKTEFGKFGDVLEKAQEKILKASDDIDELVGIRTRKIQSRLKSVQELPQNEINSVLPEETTEIDESGENKN